MSEVQDIGPEDVEDVTVVLGDPDAHRHVWHTVAGPDENDGHEIVCECGEIGYGHAGGDGFADATDELKATHAAKKAAEAPPAEPEEATS